MRRVRSILCFWFLLAPALSLFADDDVRLPQEEFDRMQGLMNRVHKAADSYPPDLSSDSERAEVEKAWAELEKIFRALSDRHPESFGMKVNLGKVYRMGYNLDIEGT